MAISIVTGLPGFGKTLKLAEFGYRAMLRGKHVYANFMMMNLPYHHLFHHYNDPLEVLGNPDVTDSLILMSEVNILLSIRKMYKIPEATWDEFRQHRKDGNNIICDAQDLTDMAWMFKGIIQFRYHIYMKMKFTKTRAFQLIRVSDPQPKGMDYGRRYWIFNPKYFQYYDTNYKLEKNVGLFESSQERIISPWMDYEAERYQQILTERK